MFVREAPSVVILCLLALLLASASAQLGLNEELSASGRLTRLLTLHNPLAKNFTLNPPTREEEDESVNCQADCQHPSGDPVCGTNGKTYNSRCDLEKDICRSVNVRLKHTGECSLMEKCEDERNFQLQQAERGENVYVPNCLQDGSYAPVQCHNFTLYCWCSRVDGKPIHGTIKNNGIPQCEGDRSSAPAQDPPKGKWKESQGSNPAGQILLSLSTATPTARPGSRPRKRPLSRSGPKRCTGDNRNTFVRTLQENFVIEYRRETGSSRRASKSGRKGNRGEDRMLREAKKWKFSQLDVDGDGLLKRREYRGLRKTARKFVRPKKCAKEFPRLCDDNNDAKLSQEEWINCLTVKNGRKGGNRGGRRCRNGRPCDAGTKPQKSTPSCERDRNEAIEAGSQIPILTCHPSGKYNSLQCIGDYCFCVDKETGNSIDGTAVMNGTPNCSKPFPQAREWPGCTKEMKKRFLKDLSKYLLSKAENDDNSRSVSADDPSQSVEEFAALYHFQHLDRNKNSYIEKNERKIARRFLTGNPKLRRCGRKITKYCDYDRDRKVSREEWVACVVVVVKEEGGGDGGGVGEQKKRKIEDNPLLIYLVPEDEMKHRHLRREKTKIRLRTFSNQRTED